MKWKKTESAVSRKFPQYCKLPWVNINRVILEQQAVRMNCVSGILVIIPTRVLTRLAVYIYIESKFIFLTFSPSCWKSRNYRGAHSIHSVAEHLVVLSSVSGWVLETRDKFSMVVHTRYVYPSTVINEESW